MVWSSFSQCWALRQIYHSPLSPSSRDAGRQHEESHPWQTSWGRRLGICKGGIKPQGSPWKFSSIYPQNQSLPTLLHYAFTNSSDINRGLSLHHLFLEKVNLELLDNKSPGHNKSVSIQKPLWWLSSLPARLLQLCMWLFAASQLREAQEA